MARLGVGSSPLTSRTAARRWRRRPPRAGLVATPRRSATKRAVCATYAGWLRSLRTACGVRYGASVSTSRRSSGTRSAAAARSSAFGVGDVAREGDPPACVQALVEAVGHREAVQDHLDAVGALAQDGDRVVLGGARVDHERLARRARELDLRVEGALLVGARRAVAEEVQAGLADRGAAGVGGELLELGQARRRRSPSRGSGGGRSRRAPAVEPLGGLERLAAGGAVDPDGEDPRDPRAAGRRDELVVGRLAEARCVWLSITPRPAPLGEQRLEALDATRASRRRGARRPARSGAPSAASSGAASPAARGARTTIATRRPSARLRRTRSRSSARAGPWPGSTGPAPRRSGSAGARAPGGVERGVSSARSMWAPTRSARPSKSSASTGSGGTSGTRAVAVALDHRDRAAREVAVARWPARSRSGPRRRPSRPSRPAPKETSRRQVVAQRVGPEAVHDLERVEHVAQRLAHLPRRPSSR